MPKQRLTDRQLISGVTLTDLLHFVVTGDTSQSPAGSSYKGSVEQLFNGFSSYTCSTPLLLDTVNACTSAITINGNVIINGSATTINTEVIQSKDNNIVLNYSGTHLTAIGGGITLEDGQSNGVDSRIYTDSNGTWLFDPNLSASTGTINDFTANTISVTTIGNSGDCVNDLYVSNIHSCSPLNINPLDEGNIYFGSTSGVTIDLTKNRLGIGTNTPSEKLEVDGNTIINGTLTLPAGTTTDPSLILTDGGTLLTSPQIGAFEFLGTSLYFTDFTGVRRNILLAQSGFTAATVNELQDTEVSTVSSGETWYYDGGLWRNTNIISIDNNNVKATVDGDLDVSGNTIINGSLNIGTILSGTPTINLGLDSSGNVVTGISSTDFYVTGGTLNNNSIEINRNDSSNIFTISGTSGININEPATGIFTIESTGGGGGTTQTTGLTISFTSKEVYNTPTSPGTGNISDDLTGSQLGIVQKIYHNSGSVPTVPAGWVLLGDGIYFTSQLNIIYAEWVTGTRVEYWIVQEQ
jgi:hypothetical protein